MNDKSLEMIERYLISKGFDEIETDYNNVKLFRKKIKSKSEFQSDIVINASFGERLFTVVVNFGKGNGGKIYLQESMETMRYEKMIVVVNKMRVDGLDI